MLLVCSQDRRWGVVSVGMVFLMLYWGTSFPCDLRVVVCDPKEMHGETARGLSMLYQSPCELNLTLFRPGLGTVCELHCCCCSYTLGALG